MRIVQLLAHAVEEHDQLRLLTSLGHEVFSPGAYTDPAHPGVDIRPPVDAPYYADLDAACREVRERHGDELLEGRDPIDWAKADLPAAVLDWADVVLVHHVEHTWLVPQWPRLRDSGKRIVWRTVGQSVAGNEALMAPLRAEGLEIVRYSPREANIPNYCGADALIRFYADPAEFGPWTGDIPAVINITQDLARRHPYTNAEFWFEATKGLPALAIGPGSETHGGTGSVSYPKMLEFLRRARCYLYTGTQPASYTLGFIEAAMSGIPIVSIGPSHMQVFSYGPDLFEAHEFVLGAWSDKPEAVRDGLRLFLRDYDAAADRSANLRARAIELFGRDRIAAEWAAFLGVGGNVALAAEPQNVQPELAGVPSVMVSLDSFRGSTAFAGVGANDLAGLGGVPDRSPRLDLVGGVPLPSESVAERLSIPGRIGRVLTGCAVAARRLAALFGGIPTRGGRRTSGLPFGLGVVLRFARHDDHDTPAAARSVTA